MSTNADSRQETPSGRSLPLEIFPDGTDPLTAQRQTQWIWAAAGHRPDGAAGPLPAAVSPVGRRGHAVDELSRPRLSGTARAVELLPGRSPLVPLGATDRGQAAGIHRVLAAADSVCVQHGQPAAVSVPRRPAAEGHRAGVGRRPVRRVLSGHPLCERGQALRLRPVLLPADADAAHAVVGASPPDPLAVVAGGDRRHGRGILLSGRLRGRRRQPGGGLRAVDDRLPPRLARLGCLQRRAGRQFCGLASREPGDRGRCGPAADGRRALGQAFPPARAAAATGRLAPGHARRPLVGVSGGRSERRQHAELLCCLAGVAVCCRRRQVLLLAPCSAAGAELRGGRDAPLSLRRPRQAGALHAAAFCILPAVGVAGLLAWLGQAAGLPAAAALLRLGNANAVAAARWAAT